MHQIRVFWKSKRSKPLLPGQTETLVWEERSVLSFIFSALKQGKQLVHFFLYIKLESFENLWDQYPYSRVKRNCWYKRKGQCYPFIPSALDQGKQLVHFVWYHKARLDCCKNAKNAWSVQHITDGRTTCLCSNTERWKAGLFIIWIRVIYKPRYMSACHDCPNKWTQMNYWGNCILPWQKQSSTFNVKELTWSETSLVYSDGIRFPIHPHPPKKEKNPTVVYYYH